MRSILVLLACGVLAVHAASPQAVNVDDAAVLAALLGDDAPAEAPAVFAAPAFFKKGNATAALAAGLLARNKTASVLAGLGLPPKNATLAAALAALPGNGTLRAKLKRRAAGAASGGASIEAAGTSVTPGGVPARIGTVVQDASITAMPSTPYVWGATTQVTITGANFSPTAGENVVAFNLGAAGTVTAATTTSLTVQMTAQPTDLGALQATVAVYGYTTPSTTVATVVPTVTPSTASLSQQAASITILGAGFSQTVVPTVVFNLDRRHSHVQINGVSDPAQPTQVATIVPAASVTAVVSNVAQDAPASTLYGTNFNPDPTQDTVVLSSGTATVSAATTTQLDLAFTTPPTTGSLDATVITYGGASSPTLFSYFASAAGNNVTSCMVTDLRTSVNATTCVAASTTSTSPAGIAVGGGYAYIASSASGAVSACAVSNGTFVGCSTTTVATAGGAQLSAVALNPAGTVLYATDKANAAVVQCTVSGTSITGCSVAASGAPLAQPTAVAIEAQTAYIADATIDNGLIVCGINGASLGCARANLTAAAQPTALTYYASPDLTVTRLYMLNNGTNSWAACDLAASRTLGFCTAATPNAYPSGGAPSGIAAMPTLAGYNAPTLLLSFGAIVNANCDTATATCTPMPFGYSSAVAIG